VTELLVYFLTFGTCDMTFCDLYSYRSRLGDLFLKKNGMNFLHHEHGMCVFFFFFGNIFFVLDMSYDFLLPAEPWEYT